jgi:predicted small secreted protein
MLAMLMACQTVEGLGQDIETGGEAIQDAASSGRN